MTEYIPATEDVENSYAHDAESEYRDPVNYPSFVRENRREFQLWFNEVKRKERQAERERLQEIIEKKALHATSLDCYDGYCLICPEVVGLEIAIELIKGENNEQS